MRPSARRGPTSTIVATTAQQGTVAAAAAADQRTWAFRAGTSFDSDGGGLTTGSHVRLGAAAPLFGKSSFRASVVVDVPLSARELPSKAGLTTVDSWLLGATFMGLFQPWRLVSLQGGFGAGAVFTRGEGEAASGYHGHRASLWSAAGWVGGSINVQVHRRWSARLETALLGLLPHPGFVVAGSTIAHWGTPSLRTALTLEMRL